MTTKGQILLSDVWRMLDRCAPGWTRREGDHKTRITYNGKVYPGFPQGQHGKRPGRAEIQKKHVRDLCEFLGILPCAQERIELLR